MGYIARRIATFESELSLGPTGDTIFLECRHRIITAIYRPNQTISADRIAKAYDVPDSVGANVLRALLDHGYIEQSLGEPSRVIYWADQYFLDMLETCRELMTLAGIPEGNHLFLEVPGPGDDRQIAPDAEVRLHRKMRFYDVPVGNFG